MKDGFYLSPDGKHIVELVRMSSNKWFDSWNLIVEGHTVNMDGDLFWLEIILSGWEYLK